MTRRDLKYQRAPETPISEVMTKDMISAKHKIGLDEARDIMYREKVEKLVLVDDSGNLKGLITLKDLEREAQFPNACHDSRGRLRVGAAVGVHDLERVEALVAAGVDILVVDSAHGHSSNMINTVKEIKKLHDIDVIAGNIATGEAAKDLIEAGADVVKVGIGPGSICTTRVVAGTGVPQISAIMNASAVAHKMGASVIADGGIKYSGDLAKAIAAGGDVVMLGSMLAGTDESPGEQIIYQGRAFKTYRGMGSIAAMQKGSADRYFQDSGQANKLVAEGIEGMVPVKGPVGDVIFQMMGGLRSAMGYSGAESISAMQDKATMVRISGAGLNESHPHTVKITKEAPNYRGE